MQHKTPTGSGRNTIANKANPAREKTRVEILKMAKEAVDKFGGMAIIDEHYAFVDTRKFTVSPTPQVQVVPTGRGGVKKDEDDTPYRNQNLGIITTNA